VVHCHAGTRANRAAIALLDAGFTDVSVLTGGIVGWNTAVAAGEAPGADATATERPATVAPSKAQ